MTTWRRRSVLTTGATLATGGVLSSIAAGEEPGGGDLPDPDVDPNPETDAVWPSFDGDAGHARYAADAPEFDGEALEAAWTVERASGEAAVVDGVVYASSTDGIVALDAADGSTIWEYTDVDANRPSVVDDTVYVVEDELYALDAADGDVRWQTELDSEDSIGTQTVAYGSAFVVADGTLYALDIGDGSVRWELDSITAESQESDTEEAEFEFRNTTAAANGVVYALAADDDGGARLALDPETGDEVWRAEYTQHDGFGIPRARATTTAVVLGGESYYARDVLDAQTGEELGHGPSRAEGIELVLGEEIYIGGYYGDALTATALSDAAGDWGVDVLRNVNDAATIGGDTVYLHVDDTQSDDTDHSEYHNELVALEKYDGSERWTISADDLPVGRVLAIDDETLYVEHDNDLVALREDVNENAEDDTDGDDEAPKEDDNESVDEDEDGDRDPESGDEDADDEDEGVDDEYESEEDGDDGDQDEGSDDGDEDPDDIEGDGGPDDDSDRDDADGGGDDDPGDVDDGGDGDADDIGDDADDTTEDTDAETDDEADSVPGFTTGAGIVGGAVGLEWLRRRAATDAPTDSTDERTAPADEPEN